jgi:hypothetical protein
VPPTIGRANLDGTGINQAFIGGFLNQPCAVASDGTHLYFSHDQSIGRSNLDGTGVNQNFIPGVTPCNGGALAVDAAHIYWETRDGSIGRANLDGTGVNPSFIPQVGAVFGVAVDGAHIYWSTFGSIGRANLDGTGANQNLILFDPLVDQPCGVAVDAGHLYWANALGTIGRANLNGLSPDPNFIQARPPVDSLTCGVAVDSAHVYWRHSALDLVDAAGDGIGRANLDGTGVNLAFITTPEPSALAVDPSTQAVRPSRISVGDVRLAEGNAGQTAFRFAVSLDQAQAVPVSVNFATADGTATTPSDYAASQGTVTFAPGETTKTVTVQVSGDTTVEPDETFSVNLANVTGNATIADAQGVGTIVNDDQPVVVPPSRISIGDVRLAEGNAGQSLFQFAVSLDTPQAVPVSVDFATADGTATVPSDYATTTGTVTFAAGETVKTVSVAVNGDTTVEQDETFNVNLANVTGNATIVDAVGVGTIVNDDQPVTQPPSHVSINDVSMAEGNTAHTPFRFTVSLDQPQSAPVTIDFATANGTALAPSDYAATSGTVTFAPGETAKAVTVQVNGDRHREANETFSVNLSHATGNATIVDGHAAGTIVNDDGRHPWHRSRSARTG